MSISTVSQCEAENPLFCNTHVIEHVTAFAIQRSDFHAYGRLRFHRDKEQLQDIIGIAKSLHFTSGKFASMLKTGSKKERQLGIDRGGVNAEYLIALTDEVVADGDYETQTHIAQHPKTPIEAMEALIYEEWSEEPDANRRIVRLAVLSNPRTPVAILAELAQEEDLLVQVLKHENCNSDIVFMVARNYEDWQGNPELIKAIAEHPQVTEDALDFLYDWGGLEVGE